MQIRCSSNPAQGRFDELVESHGVKVRSAASRHAAAVALLARAGWRAAGNTERESSLLNLGCCLLAGVDTTLLVGQHRKAPPMGHPCLCSTHFIFHALQVLVDPAALMHVLGTKMDFVEDRLK